MSLPTCPTCVYAKGICKKTGVEIRITTGCTYHTPKSISKADKLRSMTDEELAAWIDEHESAAWCPDDPAFDPVTKECLVHDGDCRMCILDWLRQESSDVL